MNFLGKHQFSSDEHNMVVLPEAAAHKVWILDLIMWYLQIISFPVQVWRYSWEWCCQWSCPDDVSSHDICVFDGSYLHGDHDTPGECPWHHYWYQEQDVEEDNNGARTCCNWGGLAL